MSKTSRFFLLSKAKGDSKPVEQPVEDTDGVLTRHGMNVAHEYARAWVDTKSRNTNLELMYPELVGLFYDIRNDGELAREHAIPFEKSSAQPKFFTTGELKARAQKAIDHYIMKAPAKKKVPFVLK